MKIISGNVMYRKFIANSGPACDAVINGKSAVIKMIITIIILKATNKYFNFNVITPERMIKERLFYVNLGIQFQELYSRTVFQNTVSKRGEIV